MSAPRAQAPVDRDTERWVSQTLEGMTLDQRIGQLINVGIDSSFLSTGSDAFQQAATAVRDFHAGSVIVFGVGDQLGNPLNVASTLNRLQSLAPVPLLVAADFEFGLGMRLAGGTTFPRAMAFGATGDPQLAYEAARLTAMEARAIGVHLNLAPVSDVNNNPRNPVINTRSFGESPTAVAAMVSAYVRGLQAGGAQATLKHFPGHGDTAVDSHIGLPLILHPRERLDAVELVPFRAGIAAGADAVMTSHIELPAIDPAPETPATFSTAIATELLRNQLRHDGLVITDSMRMAALAKLAVSRDAVVRAVTAGHDILLDVASAEDTFFAIAAAIERGDISLDRIDASVTRILRAKARADLHRQKLVDLDVIGDQVGTRQSKAMAASVAERAITLVRDEGPPLQSELNVLYLSAVDYASGWVTPPGRTLLPMLRARWPSLKVVELTDRTSAADVEAVAASLDQYDAVVAGVFVRTMSGSGRMDLPAPLARLLNDAGRRARERRAPMAAVVFGNPYTASFLPDVPTLAVAYDYYELAERAAGRALLGETAIGGRLPVSISPEMPALHGLTRSR